MAATPTPLPAGTDIAETIGGKAFSRAIIHDAAGADVMGEAVAAPAANTLLGRLKAIVDRLGQSISITAAALPLPAGAATGAKQDEAKAALLDMGSAGSAAAIVPHDANALATTARAIYVGTAGNITLRQPGAAADVVFKSVPAGTCLPVKASHIRATGTTAADLIGLS